MPYYPSNADKVSKSGDSLTGPLVFRNASSTDAPRIWLKSDHEWISPNHYADLVRLQWMNEYYKAAQAWMDKDGVDKFAMVGHDYLASYSAALDKTFTTAQINTTTHVITLTAHGWATNDPVWFDVSSFKIADMPDGLYPYYRFFIRAVDANTVAIYRSAADATADTNRLALTNGNAAVNYTITKNNWHHHVSIETSDRSGTLGADGSLHTRYAFNYDVYPAILRYTEVDVQIANSNKLTLTGESNNELHFSHGPDRAGRRWAWQRHASTGELRLVYYTSTGLAASASFQAQLSNGFIGIGTTPDASTYRLKVSGSQWNTGGLQTNADIDAITSSNAAIQIMARSNSVGTRGGTFRFTGESNGATTYRGGFLTYNPNDNFVILGTHETADSLAASDIESIKLDRTTGNITLNKPTTVVGGMSYPISTKTANYTLLTTDHTILVDATSGNLTMTLPAAATNAGRVYIIKKIDSTANTVTIDANASELIDGVTTQVISAQWSKLTIQCNGTAWYVV